MIQDESENSVFYDGAYFNRIRYKPRNWIAEKMFLWVVQSGFIGRVVQSLGAIRKLRSKACGCDSSRLRIVDVGCAFGIDYLSALSQTDVVGIDFNRQALTHVDHPYRDKFVGSFSDYGGIIATDLILASYFYEHLSDRGKTEFLNWARQELSAEGRLILLYDLWTDNPLIKSSRHINRLKFNFEFIENDRHIGLESIDGNIERFLRHGFVIERSEALERLFCSPAIFEKLFEITGSSIYKRIIGALKCKPVWLGYVIFVRLFDSSLGKLFPLKWARIHLVVLRRG